MRPNSGRPMPRPSISPLPVPANMKKIAVGVAAGAVAYYLLYKFAIKTSEEDQGFVMMSDGFGLDDVVLGGGAFLAGCYASKLV